MGAGYEKNFKYLQQNINHGLAEIKDDHLVLTENGKFYADGIVAELFFT